MDESPAIDLKITFQATTLRALAVGKLRQAIITGQFAGGDRLVERALCEQLGVSRSVVREAIRYLEAEGLVEILPRSGPVVARLVWSQARQIYEIRRLLEAEAAAACARSVDAAVEERLRASLERIRAAFRAGTPAELLSTTSDFYEIIFRAAGHEIAWEIVQRLNGRISRLRALTLESRNRSVSGLAHMERISNAILARDPELAATAVREHLGDAAEIARAALETPG